MNHDNLGKQSGQRRLRVHVTESPVFANQWELSSKRAAPENIIQFPVEIDPVFHFSHKKSKISPKKAGKGEEKFSSRKRKQCNCQAGAGRKRSTKNKEWRKRKLDGVVILFIKL